MTDDHTNDQSQDGGDTAPAPETPGGLDRVSRRRLLQAAGVTAGVVAAAPLIKGGTAQAAAGTPSGGPGGPPEPRLVDGGDRLTTNQGVPRLRRPELAEGRRTRPDAARGLPFPREDHAFRPRAHPRARRACARRRRPRCLPGLRAAGEVHHAPASCRTRPRDAGVRALLDGGGSRGSADTARDVRGFATKFYTERGQLRPGRQQHPGLLHPGRASSSPTSSTRSSLSPTTRSRRPPSAHDTFWDFVSLSPSRCT